MPSPNTDPNKRNSGDGDPHRSGLRIFGIPCAEDARSFPQTRSGRCASPIVYLGRRPVPEGQILQFSIQIVPDRNSRYPILRKGLVPFRKVLYRTLVMSGYSLTAATLSSD